MNNENNNEIENSSSGVYSNENQNNNQELNTNQYPNNTQSYNAGQYPGSTQSYSAGQYQNSQHNSDPAYNSGNYYSYNNMNTGYGYQNIPNQGYPTPTVKEKKVKVHKKHRFGGIAKLTAAAVIFGLVSGGIFQGVNYFTEPKTEVSSNDNSGAVTIPEVNSDAASTDNNTVVPTSTSTDGIVTDVSDVVDKVMPSIVAINSTGTETTTDFFGRQISQPFQGSGSGIIIGQNNSQILIVTNNHVIQGAQTVEIVFSDETKAKATVKGSDSNADLAVLSVNMSDISKDTASKIKVATLGNSDNVKAGEMAIAIGNALGYGQSVTVGYISAVNRQVDIDSNQMTLLQTDAAINPGNSGGALLNAKGEVIGINSVKYADTDVEGMGYAIPISSAIPMINELMNRQEVAKEDQGYLGIYTDSAQNVTEAYAQRFNMPVGVYVNEVVKDSPAEKAGLKQGMIITKLNDTQIKTVDDLVNTLSYHKAGETIKVTVSVFSNGNYTDQTLSITLGEKQ